MNIGVSVLYEMSLFSCITFVCMLGASSSISFYIPCVCYIFFKQHYMCLPHQSWITYLTHKKTQRGAHAHRQKKVNVVHCLEAAHLAAEFANGMLSSVFPAGRLTVTLFPSRPNRGRMQVPAIVGRETPEERRWKCVCVFVCVCVSDVPIRLCYFFGFQKLNLKVCW